MKNPSSHLLMGAMGLLAINSPVLVDPAIMGSDSSQKMEVLNRASLKSIESSWLAVPKVCKARGFNADPVSQDHKVARDRVQAIYASFEA